MNPIRRIVVALEAILLVVMLSFPPYAGFDTQSSGRVHAFLGYYPFWQPPTPAQVFDALLRRHPSLQALGASPSEIPAERLSAFVARLNRVRLVFNASLSLVVAGVVFWLARGRRHERRT